MSLSPSKSPSELYAEQFQNSEPKFYTRIPNIIDHLTYTAIVKGVKKKKRLSIYAKELYRIIRMIAADNGADWNTTKSLAEKIGCSVGSIVKAKAELKMPMDQLDGNSLVIEKRKKLHKTAPDGKKFTTELCTRTIVDIWKWNNAFMATLKHHNQYGEPDSPHESGKGPDSPHESAPHSGPDSPGEANNISLNKNHMFKEQHPTAEAAHVCSSKKKKERMFPSEHHKKSYEWMLENGCDEKSAYSMAVSFSSNEISKASQYLATQNKKKKSKGEKITNIWGYLRQTLNGKYWENDQKKNKGA